MSRMVGTTLSVLACAVLARSAHAGDTTRDLPHDLHGIDAEVAVFLPYVQRGWREYPVGPERHSWRYLTATNRANDVAVDPKTGLVWAATYGGLVRWDPDTGRSVQQTTQPTRRVAVDVRGNVWSAGGQITGRVIEPFFVERLDPSGASQTFGARDGRRSQRHRRRVARRSLVRLRDHVLHGRARRWAHQSWSRRRRHYLWHGRRMAEPKCDRTCRRPRGRTVAHAGGLGARRLWHMCHVDAKGDSECALQLDMGVPWVHVAAVDLDGIVYAVPARGLSRDTPRVYRRETDGTWSPFGLPKESSIHSRTVYRMTVSPDGTMWFVTFPYLYRLSPDGRWSEFPDDPGTEVPAVAMEPEQRELARSAASVRTRAVFGPDGTLWFATGGGVVSVDRHDQWRTLADPDGWWPNIVGALALDREDQALFLDEPWIRGYPSGEVFQAELGSAPEHLWPPYVENGLGYPASLAVDHDGWIWTGGIGPHTLWRVSPDLVHRTPVRKGNGLLSADVLAIEASPSGDVWVARMGASRAESDGTWTTYTREQGLTSELVTAIAFSGDGSTWVGSTSYQYWTGETQNEVVHPSGVSRISATGAVVSFSDDRIGDSFVSALSVHDSGDVWVGTLEGLFKLDSAGAWHDVRLPAQPDTVPITAMVPDAIGRMWVGTMCHSGSQEPAEAGCIAVRKTDGSWSAPSGFKVIYDGYVSDVVADEAGNVWLTMSDAAGSHLHHVHADGSLTSQLWPASNSSDSMGISDRMARIDANGSMSHVGPDEGLDAVAVADVETDTHGATWFATYWYGDSLNPGTRYGTNVWRLNSDETWSVLDEVGGVPSVDVTQIEADAEGTLWFGTTEHGLVWRTSDGAWQTDTTRREILTLRRDTEGTVWAGTGDGAVSLTADGVSDAWTTADGLSANRVLDIASDTSGRPWFATELGGVSVLLEYPTPNAQTYTLGQ